MLIATLHHYFRKQLLVVFFIGVILASLLGSSVAQPAPVRAAGNLAVEIIAGYNLVVDSNVLSTSTYAPSVATVIGKICNTGDADLHDVNAFIGDYDPLVPANSTPGSYPGRDSTQPSFIDQHPHLANSGAYAFTHLGGQTGLADARRFIGALPSGACANQYWHFTYPRRKNPDNTGDQPVWGETHDPGDDLWLQFDIWATAGDGPGANAVWTMTMRNEISAMANKIEPNPLGRWFNTDADRVSPGDTITSNGVLYSLGNINKGFDNDLDFVYDYNAWLQPIGDPGYDPSCFRLIESSGVLTVTRSGGKPDMIIPFSDSLYFMNLPPDNTGGIGAVHYTFLALDGPCASTLTPYQEVASGADNEKFSGDYGAGIPPSGSVDVAVSVDKLGDVESLDVGDFITYEIPFTNQGVEPAGLPLLNTPLVISDTLPAGTEFVSSSATTGVTVLYSTDDGVTWSATAPDTLSTVTTIQYWLESTLAPGAVQTATLRLAVPSSYSGSPFIANTACASFGAGASFDCASDVVMVNGSNTLGDTVWQDNDGDGALDGGEPGVDGVTVSLYWDANGDGALALGGGDLFVRSVETAGGGLYAFSGLPNGDYLVQVDTADPELPLGYHLTTSEVHAVLGLGSSTSSPYTGADFGFGPVLSIQKTLTSGDPVYEGDLITYSLSLTNLRPGDGSGVGRACTYTLWGSQVDAAHSGSGPSDSWINPGNVFLPGEPEGSFASTNFSNNVDRLAGTGFEEPSWIGRIEKVEVLYDLYLAGQISDDDVETLIWFNDALIAAQQVADGTQIGAAELNPYGNGAANQGVYAWDVSAARQWQWSDFAGTKLDIGFYARKDGGQGDTSMYLDAIGVRLTSDQLCGGLENTIDPLLLNDTYDPALMEFFSAQPFPDSAGAGNLVWNNLGPLHAGGSIAVLVTFRALEPPDNDSDGENDPVSLVNTALVNGATLSGGAPVHPVESSASATLNPTGSLGDKVWNDNGAGGGAAGNGFQDGAESGLPGVTVYLCASSPCGSGAALQTTLTEADGGYLFTGLADGGYVVAVDSASLPGTTFTQSGDPDGACPGAGCDHSSATALNNNDANPANDNDLSLDFGYQATQNTVFGSVWIDRDGDGAQDVGENGLSGVTVSLHQSGGGLVDEVVTGANGSYRFVDLPNGDYYVVVAAGSAPLGVGWSNTADPEADLNDQTDVFGAATGGVFGTYDFGYFHTGSSSISGALYYDWDKDGARAGAEDGIAGVTVALYVDQDGDGMLDPERDARIAVAECDPDGSYQFSSLPVGDYLVVIDLHDPDFPDSYLQTEDPDQAGVCVDCDERASVLGVDGSSTYSGYDFGYFRVGYATIGDLVWQDDNANGFYNTGEPGLADIQVLLYRDAGSDEVYSPSADPLVMITNTQSDGSYLFEGLPAGDYLVMVDASDPSLPLDSYAKPYVLSTGNQNDPVWVGPLATSLESDFGFSRGAVIGDLVWQDNNGDGDPSLGEPGIDAVLVTLYVDADQDGVFSTGDTVYSTTQTSAAGVYEFTGLPAGDYVVEVDAGTLPLGYAAGAQTADPDEYPPCSTCDHQSGTALAAGQIDRSRDFGYQPPGGVGDTLWIDANDDGVPDPEEAGLRAITIWLYSCGLDTVCHSVDDILQGTTETDTGGQYSFGALADGNYYVRVDGSDADFPGGLALVYDPDESHPCSICDGDGLVFLSAGSRDFTRDFGYRYTGAYSLSGTVFHDQGGDGGLYTPVNGDSPYAHITVYLWNSLRQMVAATTTEGTGDYLFADLPNGGYTVSVNRNAPNLTGTSLTTPAAYAYYSPATIAGAPVGDLDFGFVSQVDLGDLPAPYALTLLNDDGARHSIGSLFLGSGADADADGQENGAAQGDSQDDGVVRTPGVHWAAGSAGGSVDVTVSGCPGTCYLSAWVDWGGNASFAQVGERVLLDYPVVNGSQTVQFDIPAGTSFGTNFNARFRLYPGSTNGWAQPTGLTSSGEVEDYQWSFSPTILGVLPFSGSSHGQWYPVLLVGAILPVGLAALWVFRRKVR